VECIAKFLPVLFLISLATMPLLRYLQRSAATAARLADLCERIGAPLFFVAPVMMIQCAFRAIGLVDPLCYVLFSLLPLSFTNCSSAGSASLAHCSG
jgi:hypothetical protein